MTRSEFSRKVANHVKEQYPDSKVSYAEAKLWVSMVFDVLTEEILTEDRVTLINFGTFFRKLREPHKRGDLNNPGKTIVTPAKTVVTFIPSDYLEDRVTNEAPLK